MLLRIALLLALAGVIALLVLWGRTRRKHVDFPVPDEASLPSLLRSMAGLTWGHVSEGNRVRIIQDSNFFDELLSDFESARASIHLETFLWQDGFVSDRVTAALCAKASEGVEVRVIADQRGAAQASSSTWAKLRECGVQFRVYHRARIRELVWYNHRDHRKIVVIDGCIGYTFGHGIADMWGASEQQPHGWRDTAARFEGPVVKVMIVDNAWCSIGSTNFDPRSFRINDEITVAMYDAEIADGLRRAFEADVTGAEEWTLERWKARTLGHRVVDRLSVMGKRQL